MFKHTHAHTETVRLQQLLAPQPHLKEEGTASMLHAQLAFSAITLSRAPNQGMAHPTFRLGLPKSIRTMETIPRDKPTDQPNLENPSFRHSDG